MQKIYDDIEKTAFAILLASEAITTRELYEKFEIKESTARSWKSLLLQSEVDALTKIIKLKGNQKACLYIQIKVTR